MCFHSLCNWVFVVRLFIHDRFFAYSLKKLFPLLGLQKHSADPRAFSFVKIIELIPGMFRPPMMIFVENVVGFEVCRSLINFINSQSLHCDNALIYCCHLFIADF